MPDLITSERETYEHAWALPAYADHSPGAQWLPLFLSMSQASPVRAGYPVWGLSTPTRVLDAGCGAGKGALALRELGFSVTLCDLTPAGLLPEVQDLPFIETPLWADLRSLIGPQEFVYCADVLEHIPPPFTMLVVSRLLEVAKLGVFLSISLMPDEFGKWIGKPLHQCVQTYPVWLEQLRTIADVVESRDLLHTAVFLLRAR